MRGMSHLPLRVPIVLLAFVLVWFPVATGGQSATPAAGGVLESLGLPVLEITITDDGVDAPAETVSGLQRLIVNNQTGGFTVSSLSRLPEGIMDEDYLGALAADALPDWTAEATTIGGLDLDPMMSASIVIDVASGEWLLGVSGDTMPGVVTTVLATDTASPVIAADIPVDVVWDLGAYTFDHPEPLTAGPQVWQITNTHTVLHHVVIFPADGPYTNDEIVEGLLGLFSGTPVAGGFAPMGPPIIASAALSEGESIWVELDLAPGYYAAFCFLPDPGSDVPHLMAGMVESFEVLPAD